MALTLWAVFLIGMPWRAGADIAIISDLRYIPGWFFGLLGGLYEPEDGEILGAGYICGTGPFDNGGIIVESSASTRVWVHEYGHSVYCLEHVDESANVMYGGGAGSWFSQAQCGGTDNAQIPPY